MCNNAPKEGSIDVVVPEALDLLSRDQMEMRFKRLRIHGVAIATLAEGEISELQVGLKGTMNPLLSRIWRQRRVAASEATQLNAEGVPVPRGETRRDTAICGHLWRGTGLLNNELYVGGLRQRYVKDTAIGKRILRLKLESDWSINDVPDHRIIDFTLWQRLESRQAEIDTTPRV